MYLPIKTWRQCTLLLCLFALGGVAQLVPSEESTETWRTKKKAEWSYSNVFDLSGALSSLLLSPAVQPIWNESGSVWPLGLECIHDTGCSMLSQISNRITRTLKDPIVQLKENRPDSAKPQTCQVLTRESERDGAGKKSTYVPARGTRDGAWMGFTTLSLLNNIMSEGMQQMSRIYMGLMEEALDFAYSIISATAAAFLNLVSLTLDNMFWVGSFTTRMIVNIPGCVVNITHGVVEAASWKWLTETNAFLDFLGWTPAAARWTGSLFWSIAIGVRQIAANVVHWTAQTGSWSVSNVSPVMVALTVGTFEGICFSRSLLGKIAVAVGSLGADIVHSSVQTAMWVISQATPTMIALWGWGLDGVWWIGSLASNMVKDVAKLSCNIVHISLQTALWALTTATPTFVAVIEAGVGGTCWILSLTGNIMFRIGHLGGSFVHGAIQTSVVIISTAGLGGGMHGICCLVWSLTGGILDLATNIVRGAAQTAHLILSSATPHIFDFVLWAFDGVCCIGSFATGVLIQMGQMMMPIISHMMGLMKAGIIWGGVQTARWCVSTATPAIVDLLGWVRVGAWWIGSVIGSMLIGVGYPGSGIAHASLQISSWIITGPVPFIFSVSGVLFGGAVDIICWIGMQFGRAAIGAGNLGASILYHDYEGQPQKDSTSPDKLFLSFLFFFFCFGLVPMWYQWVTTRSAPGGKPSSRSRHQGAIATSASGCHWHQGAIATSAHRSAGSGGIPRYWTLKTSGSAGFQLCDNSRFLANTAQDWLRNSEHQGCACRGRLQSAVVKKVARVENMILFTKYLNKKKELGIRRSEAGSIRQPAFASRGEDLWLFHGTTKESALSIAKCGFQLFKARDGLYGRGIYFSDSACKSDQYTRGENPKVVLLCRVALGRRYEARGQEKQPPAGYHSIFAGNSTANNRSQIHNEYVIFDSDQAYPEYIVEYS